MTINENIIASYLDGNITREEADFALGGLSFADIDIIEEAADDNDTIAYIAAGADPQEWTDDSLSFNDFQLPDLPIMAQEAENGDEDNELEIIDYSSDTDDNISEASDMDESFADTSGTDIPYLSGDADLYDIDCMDIN